MAGFEVITEVVALPLSLFATKPEKEV